MRNSAIEIAKAALTGPEQHEIEELLDQQARSLQGMREILDELSSRLQPIMRPYPFAVGGDSASHPTSIRSEVGAKIESHINAIDLESQRVRDWLQFLAV